jgi:hypothetical protein
MNTMASSTRAVTLGSDLRRTGSTHKPYCPDSFARDAGPADKDMIIALFESDHGG